MSSGKDSTKTAVVTGASAGFGAATAQALAGVGFHVFLGARRLDRLHEVAVPLGDRATVFPLDVTDPESVAAFAAHLPERLNLLVNNAGGAHRVDPLQSAQEEGWEWMWGSHAQGNPRPTPARPPA